MNKTNTLRKIVELFARNHASHYICIIVLRNTLLDDEIRQTCPPVSGVGSPE